jgi:hypothetical protein
MGEHIKPRSPLHNGLSYTRYPQAGFHPDRPLTGGLPLQQVEVEVVPEEREAPSGGASAVALAPAGSEGAAAPAARLAHRSFGANRYWQVPGGFIVENDAAESLDAHCSCPGHEDRRNPCRLNRTRIQCKRGVNQARGRPLGLLMAWLACACEKVSQTKHKDMLYEKRRDVGDEEFLSLAKRQAGRQWLVDHGFAVLLSRERPRRGGEPDEPEGIA